MASVYARKNKLYISWYDSIKQKPGSQSTGLFDTPANRKIVQEMADKLQGKLDENKKKLSALGIKRYTLDHAYKHFLKNNISKKPKTISDYNRFYKKFTEKFSPHEPTTVITKLKVEEWLFEIKQLDFAMNTIFGYYKQLNHFLNFLFEYDYVQMFKINKDIKPKTEIKEKIVLSTDDIIKIFNGLEDPKLKKTNQFKTLVYLAFYTGLRSTDLMTITVERINLDKREIKYYSPKRKIYRTVAFHEDLLPILKARCDEVQTGHIFEYSAEEAIGKAFKRYFVSLGLDGLGYTPRTFRKTFITLGRSYGMDHSIVDELTGHAHTSIANKFYNRIDHEQMLTELKKFKRPQK